jgi:DNA-binding PadR family transcriptional regulator
MKTRDAVLVALLGGPGYSRDLAGFATLIAGRHIETSHVYGAVKRMQLEGWVQKSACLIRGSGGRPRTYYQLTERGKQQARVTGHCTRKEILIRTLPRVLALHRGPPRKVAYRTIDNHLVVAQRESKS